MFLLKPSTKIAQMVLLCQKRGCRALDKKYLQMKSPESLTKIVSDYDQEIPQSQTADNPVAPRGRAAQPSRDTRKTN